MQLFVHNEKLCECEYSLFSFSCLHATLFSSYYITLYRFGIIKLCNYVGATILLFYLLFVLSTFISFLRSNI